MANRVGEIRQGRGGGAGVVSAMAGKCNPQRVVGLHQAQQGAFCKAQRVLFAMRFRVHTIGRNKEVTSEVCCLRIPAELFRV